MARTKQTSAVVPTTDKQRAIELVSAFFDGKTIEMKDPKHGVPEWVSVRDPYYWSYLTEFCKNLDKYRIAENTKG